MDFDDLKTNGNGFGDTMKEVIRRLILIIRQNRFRFEVEQKYGYTGKMDDIRTTGDIEANKAAIKKLQKSMPEIGIISEETGVIPCKNIYPEIYFTLDPLDGTRAYLRRQSDGFGPMIALIQEEKVLAAFVGDAMTNEIYGFHPDAKTVYRISDFNQGESLNNSQQKKLSGNFVLLRDNPYDLSPTAQKMFGGRKSDRLFGGININGGSIGLSMAKLWKGEFCGAIINPTITTPWDICPIIGICEKLGYVFLEIINTEKTFKTIRIKPPQRVIQFKKEILIIHESNLEELFIWTKNTLKK